MLNAIQTCLPGAGFRSDHTTQDGSGAVVVDRVRGRGV
jgi:hypothetical protein